MSRLTPILLLSGAANLVAFGVLFWSRPAAPATPAPAATVPPPTVASPAPPATWAEIAAATHFTPGAAPTADLVARLRAEGFPPDFMRSLLRRLLDEHHRAEEASAVGAIPEPGYEADQYAWNRFHHELRRATRRLEFTKAAELHALLGDDAETARERLYRHRQYGDLPYDLTVKLNQIDADYADLRQQLQDSSYRLNLASDREQLALLERERQADLAAQLTPEQLADYQLRNSSVARSLVSRLQGFEPTEAEFRAIYNLQTAYGDRLGPGGVAVVSNPNSTVNVSVNGVTTRLSGSDVAAAQAQFNQELADLLGPDRYAEYTLTTSAEYRRAVLFSLENGLAPTVTASLAQLEISTRQAQRALTRDRALSPDARTAALQELQARATTAASAVLSPQELQAYTRNFGSWLTRITPRTAPAPPPAPAPTTGSGTGI